MPKRFLLIIFIALISYLSVFGSTVKLEVLSHPSGADIYIDRVWRGTTPQVLYIAPGKHQIQLEKFGYGASSESFDLRLSSVAEYNLIPEPEILKNYPLVIYLVNYQSDGDRTVLYKEQEKALVQALWNRFTNMGFNVTIETPKDEFDLVLDKESIYLDIEKKYPKSGMFFFIDALWTFSSFQQKRVTRLETALKVYDPKSKVTLGTFKDLAESIGQMSPDIVVLQIIERISQSFLDNIGNFLVQIYTKQTSTPILLAKTYDRDITVTTIKNLSPIENLEVADFSNNLLKAEVHTALDSGINLLFVVDRSGSNTKYSEVIKQLMDLILKNLPKRIRWGILAFDDKVEVIQSFTEDYSRWTAAKEKITNAGMTRLYDGLFNAAKIVEREQGINVIILLTDGIDADYLDAAPGSIKTKKEGIDALKAAGVVVYPVGISEKNFTNLMKELALEFGTFYSDAFRHNNEKIATDILQDIVQSIAVVKTARIDNPSFYINGRRFYLSVNGRSLLNQEMIDMAVYKTAYGELSIPVTSGDTAPSSPTLVGKPEEKLTTPPETVTTPASPIQETALASPVKPEITISTEPVSPPATQTTPHSTEVSEGPAKTDLKEEATSPATKTTQPTSVSDGLVLPIQWPEDFNQILELRFSELYDLDPNGDFIWTERNTGYLWLRNQRTLLGIDLKDTPVMIDLCYPYLAVLYVNRVEVATLGEKIYRLYAAPVATVPSCMTISKNGVLTLGYKNGLVQAFDKAGKVLKEFKVENAALQQIVVDDQNRLIFLASSQKVGWTELSPNTIVHTKELQRPIIRIAPFLIDKARFFAVDAGGDVYYIRFDDFSEQKRNLNRGIVMQSHFAEDQNQLFTYHWDKTLRVFRVYDLKEIAQIQTNTMILGFEIDASGRSVAIQTEDKTIYLGIQGSENLPGFIDRYEELLPLDKNQVATEPERPTILAQTAPATQSTVSVQDPVQPASTVTEPPIAVQTPMIAVAPLVESEAERNVPPTMSQLYGYWEYGAAYRDMGYFVASSGCVAWLNLILDTTARYELQPGVIRDLDISRNGLVGLLLEDRIELWDAKYMAENQKVTTYKGMKYALKDGVRLTFSRTGRKILIVLYDGRVTMLNSDLTGQMVLESKINATAICPDLTQTDAFVIGTDKGELIWLSENGIYQRESVSDQAISEVLFAYGDIYWGDRSGNMGVFKKKTMRLEGGYVTSLYAPDNGKNWIVVGSSTGNLYIYANEFSRLMGKANLGETPVTGIHGYMDTMLTVNEDRSLRSWNVSQIGVLTTKPPLRHSLGMYSEQNLLGFVTTDGNNFIIDTEKGSMLPRKLDIGTSRVEQFHKKPPVIRVNDNFYSIQKNTLSEKSYKAYENDKLNTADKFLLFWSGDLLKVIDLETGSTIRTLKFGEPNVVTWGTMVNKRLIFFLEGKMGIVNPYKPEDLLIVDVADEKIGKILEVFIYQDRLIVVDDNGLIHQYGMMESKFLTPLNLTQKLTKVYYNSARLQLIGYYGNRIIRFSPVDNDIQVDYVQGVIKDIDWTDRSFFALTEDGILWGKGF